MSDYIKKKFVLKEMEIRSKVDQIYIESDQIYIESDIKRSKKTI